MSPKVNSKTSTTHNEEPEYSTKQTDVTYVNSTNGDTLAEKISSYVPCPGDTVTLGNQGHYIAIRTHWTYADEADDPAVTITVRAISQPGGF